MFEKRIRSEIEISGTPQEVWGVLTDFASYPEWNPGFDSVEGRVAVGETLRVTFAKEGGKGQTLHPKVLVADPGREFSWIGRLLIPSIFDGEHHFEIHELEPGRVRFVQWERFSGILTPFLRKLIDVDTPSTFEKVNAALADRVRARQDAA
jgi:hypothetical protein